MRMRTVYSRHGPLQLCIVLLSAVVHAHILPSSFTNTQANIHAHTHTYMKVRTHFQTITHMHVHT